MEHGVGGRPEQPHAAVPLSGRRSAGASVRLPRTPGSPSSAAHAGGVIACLSRMRGRRPSRVQVGVLDAPAPVPIWPPAKPGVCRPDAATTWRGPTAPMRGPTWAGLHSRMWWVSLDRPWAGGYLQPPRVRESPSPDRRASAGRLLPPVRTRGRGKPRPVVSRILCKFDHGRGGRGPLWATRSVVHRARV